MSILDKVVRIEKSIEKLAARRDAPVTALEIRRAILDDIEEQVVPAGRSRRVFPYDEIAIEVRAGGDTRPAPATTSRRTAGPPLPPRAELQAVLDPDAGLTDAIRERLQEAGCDRIGSLKVSVSVIRKARADWKPGTAFRVAYNRRQPSAGAGGERGTPARAIIGSAPAAAQQAGGTVAADELPPASQAQVVVMEGAATKKSYAVSGERTNIGRLAEVTDKHRRVVRRNQIVFLEVDSETNQTVSRAQAHIRFTPPDEYRLFDDHSSYGTRIVRGGRMIELPSGSPRGVRLQAGDEIYFGRARVVFQIKQ